MAQGAFESQSPTGKFPVAVFSRGATFRADPKFLEMFEVVTELDVDHLFSPSALPAWKHSGQSLAIRDSCCKGAGFQAALNTVLAHGQGAQGLGFRSAGVGFTCRDGYHVSVAVAEEIAAILAEKGFEVSLFHLCADQWRLACRQGTCGQCSGALQNS